MTTRERAAIDVTFDVRTDATTDDPDQSSATLRRYHQLLWSKPLPDGTPFLLDALTPRAYLHHASAVGEFFLSSDSITHSYATWRSTDELIRQVNPIELEAFRSLGYTVGGMVIFPSTKVERRPTINMARGVHRDIRDRFDLTLECIRRFYLGDEATPLGCVLARYRPFFDLFRDFRGYVDFFLLHDLTDDDVARVRFHLPFAGFDGNPLPQTLEQYDAYRHATEAFLRARNVRIARWAGT